MLRTNNASRDDIQRIEAIEGVLAMTPREKRDMPGLIVLALAAFAVVLQSAFGFARSGPLQANRSAPFWVNLIYAVLVRETEKASYSGLPLRS